MKLNLKSLKRMKMLAVVLGMAAAGVCYGCNSAGKRTVWNWFWKRNPAQRKRPVWRMGVQRLRI